jgi:hypothetical protein
MQFMIRSPLHRLGFLAAALLVLAPLPARAGPQDASFNVQLRLLTGATCSTDTSTAAPQLVCDDNGRRFVESAQRYIAELRDGFVVAGDGYAGSGIFTLYRRLRFGEREYIEMMVGW